MKNSTGSGARSKGNGPIVSAAKAAAKKWAQGTKMPRRDTATLGPARPPKPQIPGAPQPFRPGYATKAPGFIADVIDYKKNPKSGSNHGFNDLLMGLDAIFDPSVESFLNLGDGVGTVIEAINSPEWYGGSSNQISARHYDLSATYDDVTDQTLRVINAIMGTFTDTTDTVLYAQIQAVIDAIGASAGYVPSISASDVLVFLDASEAALAKFWTLKRAQDCKLMRTKRGHKMSNLLNGTIQASVALTIAAVNDAAITTSPAITVPIGEDIISNKEWSDYVNRLLAVARVSERMYNFTRYHYEGVFNTDVLHGSDHLIRFTPLGTYTWTQIKADILSLEATRAATPEMEMVLNYLGIGSLMPHATDFDRAFTSMSLLVKEDPILNIALGNALGTIVNGAATTYPTGAQAGLAYDLIRIPRPRTALTLSEDFVSLPIGVFWEIAKFRSKQGTTSGMLIHSISTLMGDGSVYARPFFYPGVLLVPSALPTVLAEAQALHSNVTNSLTASGAFGLPLQFLSLGINSDCQVATAAVTSDMAASGCGSDAFIIPDIENPLALGLRSLVAGVDANAGIMARLEGVKSSFRTVSVIH